MTEQYFKRYRMEFSLTGVVIAQPVLPEGYRWDAWHAGDADRHAIVKYHAFRDEVDADVFDSLSSYHGCRGLMRDIALQPGFLPQATWLIRLDAMDALTPPDCGTIQGVVVSEHLGSIQNVGVVPTHRGQGLGRALVQQALRGFQSAGLKRAALEVTAANHAAVELYKHVGFHITKTMYRAVPLEVVDA